MKRFVFIFMALLSLGGCGREEIPTNDLSSSTATLQIYRKGENQPLSSLGGLHPGDTVHLEARGEGLKSPPQWFSADPTSGVFLSDGELSLKAPGHFLIGAWTDEASDYIPVQVLSLPAGSSSSPGSGGAPSRPPSIPSDPFVDEVISFTPGPGAGFGSDRFPEIVLGPPKGGGLLAGGLDVLSLGVGGEIVLKSDTPILNGPGVDFIVFENAFYAEGNPKAPFAEPGEVAVSQDGKNFVAFPCAAQDRQDLYPGCAGVHPVLANSDLNRIDPTDPATAGGDDFDLEDLGLDWAQFIRIRDLSTEGGGINAGFDLDAISIVHQ